jgi:hypothetical protein
MVLSLSFLNDPKDKTLKLLRLYVFKDVKIIIKNSTFFMWELALDESHMKTSFSLIPLYVLVITLLMRQLSHEEDRLPHQRHSGKGKLGDLALVSEPLFFSCSERSVSMLKDTSKCHLRGRNKEIELLTENVSSQKNQMISKSLYV